MILTQSQMMRNCLPLGRAETDTRDMAGDQGAQPLQDLIDARHERFVLQHPDQTVKEGLIGQGLGQGISGIKPRFVLQDEGQPASGAWLIQQAATLGP